MPYSARFEKHGAYHFSEESIGDLWNISEKFLGRKPLISIELVPDHQIESNDLAEALQDSYVRSKTIKWIKIGGLNFEPSKRIEVSLKSEFLDPIQVSVSGDRDGCTLARNDIENVIRGRAVWYSKFILPNQLLNLTAFLATTGLILGCIVILLNYVFHVSVYNASESAVNVIVIPEIGLLFLLYYFLRKKMFPKLTFGVGISADVASSARVWRNIIGGLLIAGLVISILGGAIFERLPVWMRANP